MKVFSYGKDGGPDSCVWGYWLIEIKSLFSVALLCFEDGSREEFHSHAFNSVSWVLSGWLDEEFMDYSRKNHWPGLKPVITKRDTFHRVRSVGRSWVLTFRGPWSKEWKEFSPAKEEYATLTNGRKVVERKTGTR